MAHLPEHVVQQGGDGGLAVGSGHAHKPQPPRRLAVEDCGHGAHGVLGGGHLHVGHALRPLVGHVLHEHCLGALLYGLANELVAVNLGYLDGHEEMSVLNLA